MTKFRVQKNSGTYAELLEAYGLANLLAEVLQRSDMDDQDIFLTDQGGFYEIQTETSVTEELVRECRYFPLFRYIRQNNVSDIEGVYDYFDYPLQREWKKERQNLLNKAYEKYRDESLNKELKRIEHIYEEQKPIDVELDVCAQISTPNNIVSFLKLYRNFHDNRIIFTDILAEIIKYYAVEVYDGKAFHKLVKSYVFEEQVTATQLYNPHKGQGVAKPKATGVNRINLDSSWIKETMKISGALSDMICQLVKVGNSYDLKVSVPEYRQVNYYLKRKLLSKLKKYLKGNTPIKIDILNLLLMTEVFIQYRGNLGIRSVKEVVSGLHTVYQKDMGQNKAVINIGYMQIPDFIYLKDADYDREWLDILQEQRAIVGGITEKGEGIEGLVLYRNFLSASDVYSFFKFSFWYAGYAFSQSFKRYVRLFSIETLIKFHTNMDTHELNLSEIISNKGFLAVAKAIRQSTVMLQYLPKEKRIYDIRYGIAQELRNKSKSYGDLAQFIGDFVAGYNEETARVVEKRKKISENTDQEKIRANVKIEELNDFYSLLDRYGNRPQLVGALLASYGFARPSSTIDKSIPMETETEEL